MLKEIQEATTFDQRSPIEKFDDMAGRTFLMDIKDDGTRDRAKIIQVVEGIDRFQNEVDNNEERIKFLVKI